MKSTLRKLLAKPFRSFRRRMLWRLPDYRASWRSAWDFARNWSRRQWEGRVWPKVEPVPKSKNGPCPAQPTPGRLIHCELEACPTREAAAASGLPESAYDQLATLRIHSLETLLRRVAALERDLGHRAGGRLTGELQGRRRVHEPAPPLLAGMPGDVERTCEVIVVAPARRPTPPRLE